MSFTKNFTITLLWRIFHPFHLEHLRNSLIYDSFLSESKYTTLTFILVRLQSSMKFFSIVMLRLTVLVFRLLDMHTYGTFQEFLLLQQPLYIFKILHDLSLINNHQQLINSKKENQRDEELGFWADLFVFSSWWSKLDLFFSLSRCYLSTLFCLSLFLLLSQH